MATPWTEQALCTQTDPDVFEPRPGRPPKAARRICGLCDVKGECLTEAMLVEGDTWHHNRWGIYGGLDPEQRWLLSRGGRVVAIDPVLSTPA